MSLNKNIPDLPELITEPVDASLLEIFDFASKRNKSITYDNFRSFILSLAGTVKEYSETINLIQDIQYTLTHNLNTKNILVKSYLNDEEIQVDIKILSLNTIGIESIDPITVKVVILG